MTRSPPTTRHLARSLCAALLLGLAAAQQAAPEPSLAGFLGALEGHPELLAAQAAVQAAELQKRRTLGSLRLCRFIAIDPCRQ